VLTIMPKLFKLHLKDQFNMYIIFGKRCLDVSLSFLAILLLSPIFLITSLLIKIFDPGPIIFCQQRIGLCGSSFEFYKFRSMPLNTGDVPSDKIGQVQLTWIGRFIRRSNIDELPQLFNILKGDMSIVGPRPPLGSQTELIELRQKNGSIRCRPGLTGLAQVSSFNGMKVSEKAEFDAHYANSISFNKDILIIFKTFSYLMKPPPVY
jgi:O-antigen biosynthesis protein WbqP